MGIFPRLTLIVSVLTRGRNLSKIMLNAVSIATLVIILILFFGIKKSSLIPSHIKKVRFCSEKRGHCLCKFIMQQWDARALPQVPFVEKRLFVLRSTPRTLSTLRKALYSAICEYFITVSLQNQWHNCEFEFDYTKNAFLQTAAVFKHLTNLFCCSIITSKLWRRHGITDTHRELYICWKYGIWKSYRFRASLR